MYLKTLTAFILYQISWLLHCSVGFLICSQVTIMSIIDFLSITVSNEGLTGGQKLQMHSLMTTLNCVVVP